MVYRSYVLENAGIFRYIMVAMAIILIIYLILKFKFKVFSFEDVLFVAFFIISILALNKTQIFKYDHYHQSIIYLVSSALQLILIKNKKNKNHLCLTTKVVYFSSILNLCPVYL